MKIRTIILLICVSGAMSGTFKAYGQKVKVGYARRAKKMNKLVDEWMEIK